MKYCITNNEQTTASYHGIIWMTPTKNNEQKEQVIKQYTQNDSSYLKLKDK